jgi:hypothetical protein
VGGWSADPQSPGGLEAQFYKWRLSVSQWDLSRTQTQRRGAGPASAFAFFPPPSGLFGFCFFTSKGREERTSIWGMGEGTRGFGALLEQHCHQEESVLNRRPWRKECYKGMSCHAIPEAMMESRAPVDRACNPSYLGD